MIPTTQPPLRATDGEDERLGRWHGGFLDVGFRQHGASASHSCGILCRPEEVDLCEVTSLSVPQQSRNVEPEPNVLKYQTRCSLCDVCVPV